MFNIIPAIDLLDQKVVRLKQGNYDDVTFYDYSPVELAQQFEQAGATRLHIVDLNGARDGSVVHGEIITAIRAHTDLDIQVGGGIRHAKSASFYFDCGVNNIIIGSLLISDFEQASSIIHLFPNNIIAGIDAKSNQVATEGWEKTSHLTTDTLVSSLNSLPLASIIYTDIAKDGMMLGPNLDQLATIAQLSTHPIIASGGIRDSADISKIKAIQNVSGCIVGKAILGQHVTLDAIFNSSN